jgi:hypothetical protein
MQTHPKSCALFWVADANTFEVMHTVWGSRCKHIRNSAHRWSVLTFAFTKSSTLCGVVGAKTSDVICTIGVCHFQHLRNHPWGGWHKHIQSHLHYFWDCLHKLKKENPSRKVSLKRVLVETKRKRFVDVGSGFSLRVIASAHQCCTHGGWDVQCSFSCGTCPIVLNYSCRQLWPESHPTASNDPQLPQRVLRYHTTQPRQF